MIDITQQKTLEKIKDIIFSCKTLDQINNVQNWIYALDLQIYRYNQRCVFKYTLFGNLKYKYKQLRNEIDWIFTNLNLLINQQRTLIYENKLKIVNYEL